MDETGQSTDTGTADGGTGDESRERPASNGWGRSPSPWAVQPTADPGDDVPAWRRPSADQEGAARPGGSASNASAENTGSAWSTGRARFSGLLAHLSPGTTSPGATRTPEPAAASPASLQPGPVPTGPPPSDPYPAATAFAERAGGPEFGRRPDTLQADDLRRSALLPTPSSAPPYPYEGDLEDEPIAQQRAAVPLSRPAGPIPPPVPAGRRVDWITPEPARHAHAANTPIGGLPQVETPSAGASLATGASKATGASLARTPYDPGSFPRRLPYEPSGPRPAEPPAARPTDPPAASLVYGGPPGADPSAGRPESVPKALPQRVPAEPDVPDVPEPPPVEPSAETPALAARIATHLRRGDVPSADERHEGFDVDAILTAVKEVDGVRDASLRANPGGAHSLRLDLAEGADPAEVSRQVARLLQDRMGLDAAMPGAATMPGTPVPPARASQAARTESRVRSEPHTVPAQAIPAGRAPVSAAPAPVANWHPASRDAAGVVERPDSLAYAPPQPLPIGDRPGPRVILENVQVNTFGTDATVEVRLGVGGRLAAGVATGPAVDGYLLRLCAVATTQALDELVQGSRRTDGPARFFVEHAAAVSFGPVQVAVVVLLLSCGGWVEQLAGSAVVAGDDRQAMVRATLAAVNRRLEALLS